MKIQTTTAASYSRKAVIESVQKAADDKREAYEYLKQNPGDRSRSEYRKELEEVDAFFHMYLDAKETVEFTPGDTLQEMLNSTAAAAEGRFGQLEGSLESAKYGALAVGGFATVLGAFAGGSFLDFVGTVAASAVCGAVAGAGLHLWAQEANREAAKESLFNLKLAKKLHEDSLGPN